MSRVLVVGAGLTGSLCACLLRRDLSGLEVVVWDKARGAGGRMSTCRPPDPSTSSADLGAQYITATAAYARSHHSVYSELLSSGLLLPLDSSSVEGLRSRDGSSDFMTPLGMSSIVKHFLSQSGAAVFLDHQVSGLVRRGASWEVRTTSGGSETFDAVVLTMPVPQILQLQGDLGEILSVSQRQSLESVVYSSRFAVALFFPSSAVLSFSWSVRYVNNNKVICYISADSRKRRADSPGVVGPSLVVHSSVPFGLEHLDKDKAEVEPMILAELRRLLPDLPQPIGVKCHKWRYSQVLTSVPDSPGHMTVLDRPLLVCAGDAFSHSNFDGCLESALSAVRALKEAL